MGLRRELQSGALLALAKTSSLLSNVWCELRDGTFLQRTAGLPKAYRLLFATRVCLSLLRLLEKEPATNFWRQTPFFESSWFFPGWS